MKKLLIILITFGSLGFGMLSIEHNIDIDNIELDAEKTDITWTAYKTTDKIPVKGTFKEIILTQSKPSNDVKSALANTHFEIPVSSVFSQNILRDDKIKKSFFGAMIKTSTLTGSFSLSSNTEGKVHLYMNGIKSDIPFTYSIKEGNILIEATMNLDNWKAQAAVAMLNDACEDLHAGVDGITKTWNEVNIKVKTRIK